MQYENLGLCCQCLCDDGYHKNNNILVQKILQLNRYKKGLYSSDHILDTYIQNTTTLLKNLPRIFQTYKVFRMPSGFFPLYDLVDHSLWNNDVIIKNLKSIGKIIVDNNVRVTFHPGQFCSLSSDSETVVKNSIAELMHHAWIMDQMSLDVIPYYAINIHGGKRDRHNALVRSILELPDNVRFRLTLENDESCYSVGDLLMVYKETQTPIVFDSHHHSFNNDGLSFQEAYAACIETWGNIKPKQHISSTTPGLENSSYQNRRKHGNYITSIPKCQYDGCVRNEIDLMVEAKLKNFAIEHLRISIDNLDLGNIKVVDD